jgi:hypothetical protein
VQQEGTRYVEAIDVDFVQEGAFAMEADIRGKRRRQALEERKRQRNRVVEVRERVAALEAST